MSDSGSGMTFWDRLDELRTVIIRILVVTMLGAVAAFCLKEQLFSVVLAPRTGDFITYRLMGVEPFSIHLMNTGLTEQFMIHVKTAMCAGLLLVSPYIIYQACSVLCLRHSTTTNDTMPPYLFRADTRCFCLAHCSTIS